MSELEPGVLVNIDTRTNPDHWIWTGTTNYGTDWGAPKFKGKYVRALVWRAYRDEPLAEGMPLKTTCGVARCVKPEHLLEAPEKKKGTAPADAGRTLDLLELINIRLENIERHLGIGDPFDKVARRDTL